MACGMTFWLHANHQIISAIDQSEIKNENVNLDTLCMTNLQVNVMLLRDTVLVYYEVGTIDHANQI